MGALMIYGSYNDFLIHNDRLSQEYLEMLGRIILREKNLMIFKTD
jgi:hypothetical protein